MYPHQEEIIYRFKEAYGIEGEKDEILADKMGLAKSSISNYRRAQRKICAPLIFQVAEDTKRSPEWLLTGKHLDATKEKDNDAEDNALRLTSSLVARNLELKETIVKIKDIIKKHKPKTKREKRYGFPEIKRLLAL